MVYYEPTKTHTLIEERRMTLKTIVIDEVSGYSPTKALNRVGNFEVIYFDTRKEFVARNPAILIQLFGDNVTFIGRRIQHQRVRDGRLTLGGDLLPLMGSHQPLGYGDWHGSRSLFLKKIQAAELVSGGFSALFKFIAENYEEAAEAPMALLMGSRGFKKTMDYFLKPLMGNRY